MRTASSSSRTYDARWGVVLIATDVKNQTANYIYDAFGRLVMAQGPLVAGPSGPYGGTTHYTYGIPTMTGNGRTTTLLTKQVRTDLGGVATQWLPSWSVYD